MALRFVDSFDHYDSAHVGDKWTVPGNLTINNVNQRTGPQCGAFGNSVTSKTIDQQSTWIVGCAIQCPILGGSIGFGYTAPLLGQVFISINGDGTVSAYNGAIGAGTLLGTSAAGPNNVIIANRYYYLEIKVHIGLPGAGSVEVRLNGLPILVLVGVNTDHFSSGHADCLVIAGAGGGSPLIVDDLYVCDGTGSVNNDFLGDVEIGCIFPSSDGALLQYAPSTPGTHFSMVNEAPPASPVPDDDTTYISDSNPGDRECYNFQPVNTSRTYKGIQVCITARKDDAGSRTFAAIQRSATGAVFQSSSAAPNATYVTYIFPEDQNPDGVKPWTGADINATQFGVTTVL